MSREYITAKRLGVDNVKTLGNISICMNVHTNAFNSKFPSMVSFPQDCEPQGGARGKVLDTVCATKYSDILKVDGFQE